MHWHHFDDDGQKSLSLEAESNFDNLVGGGGRPLGEKLPDGFEVKLPYGRTRILTNGLELHRLVLVEDYDQLERRSKELDKEIINAKCLSGPNEVSEPPYSLSSPGDATVSRLRVQRHQLRPPPSQPRR